MDIYSVDFFVSTETSEMNLIWRANNMKNCLSDINICLNKIFW